MPYPQLSQKMQVDILLWPKQAQHDQQQKIGMNVETGKRANSQKRVSSTIMIQLQKPASE